MSKLSVGVIASGYLVNGRSASQFVREKNLRAVVQVSDALPLMFAGAPGLTDIGPLLDTVDGILLTGDRTNIHPSHFNAEPHPRHEPYDRDRDERWRCMWRRPALSGASPSWAYVAASRRWELPSGAPCIRKSASCPGA